MAISTLLCMQTRLFAEGLVKLLGEDPEIQVLGPVGNRIDLNRALAEKPEIILVDSAGFKMLISPDSPETKAKILLLGENSPDLPLPRLQQMIAKGLAGIIDQHSSIALLRKAIHKVHEGELWLDRQTIRDAFRRPESSEEVQLTRREEEILAQICAGSTNKEIANRLCISEQTVKTHCNHLFKKFHVSNRLQLALRAGEMSSHLAH